MDSQSEEVGAGASVKLMRLRYTGTCACGIRVTAGERAGYDTTTRAVVCPACLGVALAARDPATSPVNQPGASLLRTYERRASKREQRIRTRFPRIGGLLVKVTPEPASTTAFKKGAEGEVSAARRLVEDSGDNVLFLMNRRLGVGRRDGDIDLIAISATGVVIIDVKHYKGARVEVRREGVLWQQKVERLFVGGRDKTSWLESMNRQRNAVADALISRWPAVDITCAFCFVDADLPLFGKLAVGDITICGARQLGKRLKSADGPLSEDARLLIRDHLSSRLPAA